MKDTNGGGKWGKTPIITDDQKKFNANMTNTGEKAKAFARKLTTGLDKAAFPVK